MAQQTPTCPCCERTMRLEKQIRQLQASHADMVLRNQLLRNRPDLPIERVKGYDAIMARIAKLEDENRQLVRACNELASLCPRKLPDWIDELLADHCRRNSVSP